MPSSDASAALERDALRIAARALAELASGPVRAKAELFAHVLEALRTRLGAEAAVAAERITPAHGGGGLRVIAACGAAAPRFALGDALGPEREALQRAVATLAPAHEPARADEPALLVLPLHARGELLGAIALEGCADAHAAAALADFAEACGELLLGYERTAVRARAEHDLMRSQLHLRRSADLDGLTALASRACTARALDDAATRSHAAGLPLAVVVLDVDDAKALADRVGPGAFDEAIAQTARLVHETLRPSDWTGRWSVDAFVVTLIACDAEAAGVVAERLRLRVEGASIPVWGGAEISLTVSVGVAATGLLREEGNALLARASGALEQAKRAGRNRVCVSRPARA